MLTVIWPLQAFQSYNDDSPTVSVHVEAVNSLLINSKDCLTIKIFCNGFIITRILHQIFMFYDKVISVSGYNKSGITKLVLI